jgi:hypothetical protein
MVQGMRRLQRREVAQEQVLDKALAVQEAMPDKTAVHPPRHGGDAVAVAEAAMVSPAAIPAVADGPSVYPFCDPASIFAGEEAYQEQQQAGGESVWFVTAVCGG